MAFLWACSQPTAINQLLTVLRDTASGCQHITEMGVGQGHSTLAWLIVQPEKLVCYDICPYDCMPGLLEVKGKTDLQFHIVDSRSVEIEETDLLFIDTIHTYSQLNEELRLHADKARRFLVFHDTTTFGSIGEDGKSPGLWRAIEELLQKDPEWALTHRFTHNNGLTILHRRTPTYTSVVSDKEWLAAKTIGEFTKLQNRIFKAGGGR
jgi:hypothetical protein